MKQTMVFFWVLIVLLVGVLAGVVIFVGGQFFSEEKELIHEAERKIEKGHEEEALSLLSRVTELNPANFKARWRLAKLLQMMGQYGAAAYHLEYCLENDALPRHVRIRDALVRLAEVYENQGHYEDAADAWTRYLQQVSDSVEGYFRRGRSFFEQNKFKRAIADFRKIRSDFPEDEPDQNALYLGRCYLRSEDAETALEYYEEYMEANPRDFEGAIETAHAAKASEQFSRARHWYEHVRENAPTTLYVDATIQTIRLSLEQDQPDRAEKYLEELEEMGEKGELSDRQALHVRYLRARLLELNQEREEAVDIYWEIYEQNPDFLDIPEIIEEEIGRMDPDDLLDDFMSCDRQRFTEQSENITRMMGYEVMSSESYSPYEINVSAREEGSGLKADRILVTFKRWESEVGEWPIREFELNLLEDRYDRGIFVAPHGFKPRAHQFVEDSSIRLIGPETLIQYLREAHKHS